MPIARLGDDLVAPRSPVHLGVGREGRERVVYPRFVETDVCWVLFVPKTRLREVVDSWPVGEDQRKLLFHCRKG